jgi:MscS family membrane protein
MENLHPLLAREFLGNTLGQYALTVLILLLGLIFKRFVSRLSNRFFFRLFGKHADGIHVNRFHELLQKPVSFTLMLIVVFVAFANIQYPPAWGLSPREQFGIPFIIYNTYRLLLFSGFIWIGLRLADFVAVIMTQRATLAENKYGTQVIPFMVDAIKLLLVIFGVLIMLSSIFRINVGTLVAGLGIGGLAVALAARESLENLLGSFTIFLDKPFVVGDMVKVGAITGVVEKVGFRSTRLRTLEKSYVTLPNKKMVDSELDNLTLRTFRRSHFDIGLTYSTTVEQMKAVVRDIQELVDNHPNTNQDGRVRFRGFGPSSLDIMIVYFVDTMDWTTYLNVKEEINYSIMEIVHRNGASFAFPSTSVYIEKSAPKE